MGLPLAPIHNLERELSDPMRAIGLPGRHSFGNAGKSTKGVAFTVARRPDWSASGIETIRAIARTRPYAGPCRIPGAADRSPEAGMLIVTTWLCAAGAVAAIVALGCALRPGSRLDLAEWNAVEA